MRRLRAVWVVLGLSAAAVLVSRHGRRLGGAHDLPGGIVMGDAARYDIVSRLLLGSLFERIANDAAAAVPGGGRVLEVGCGPGRLSIALAGRRGLEVTGLDLDPAMIERARASAARTGDSQGPSFRVGDVAALPFPDGTFDLVVSTFSLHHWADPTAGLVEIGRVLRPGAHALVWDFRPGARLHPFARRHRHLPDPVQRAHGSGLDVASVTPWRWPWRFTFAQRFDLVRDTAS